MISKAAIRLSLAASLMAACFLLASGAETSQSRLSLGVDGTRFTLNGRVAFLLGSSYYAGLGASPEAIDRDLGMLKERGFNWIRVWATWRGFDNDVSAVDSEGNPREKQMLSLRRLIRECERRGVVVDVTLSRGDGENGSPRLQGLAAHRRAVESILNSLKEYRNWYLDLANERNIQDKRFASFEDLRALRESAKRLRADLLMTASQGGDISRDELKKYLIDAQMDFITPHRPRSPVSPGQTESKTREYLNWMKELGRHAPVHYQEPFRRGYGEYEPDSAAFIADLGGAIRGGAAGWCFHNGSSRARPDGLPRRSFDLRGGALFDHLDSVELEVTKQAAAALRAAQTREKE